MQMREPTRIAGMFGLIGLSTFALLVLASLASAQQVQIYDNTRKAPTEVIILNPGAAMADPATAEARMRANVVTRLTGTPSLGGSNLTVTSNGGTVILDGTVIEAPDISEAEAVARQTAGVTGVVNRIRIDPTYAGSAVMVPVLPASDAALALNVAQALASHFGSAHIEGDGPGYDVEIERHDQSANDWRIDVESYNGQVTLGGVLPNYDAVGRALTVAREVSGVRGVQSNLMLAGSDYDEDGTASVGPFQKPQYRPFWHRDRDRID